MAAGDGADRALASARARPDARPAIERSFHPSPARGDRAVGGRPPRAVAVAIEPEIDRELEDLRRRPTHGTPLERMLRGDHRAMVEVVDAVAGEDSRQRRSWELLLGGLVEAMADIAVRESVIDLPMGTAFWDMFTIEQCRRIVAALGSMGYRYDGAAGWADSRVPAYVDLTPRPRRRRRRAAPIRAWPNQSEIATLFVGAGPRPRSCCRGRARLRRRRHAGAARRARRRPRGPVAHLGGDPADPVRRDRPRGGRRPGRLT